MSVSWVEFLVFRIGLNPVDAKEGRQRFATPSNGHPVRIMQLGARERYQEQRASALGPRTLLGATDPPKPAQLRAEELCRSIAAMGFTVVRLPFSSGLEQGEKHQCDWRMGRKKGSGGSIRMDRLSVNQLDVLC